MAQVGRQLGQVRPTDTNNTVLYSPIEGVRAEITNIVICNTTSNTATFRIFHDDDGTTYNETTALYWDGTILANETIVLYGEIHPGLAMYNPDGNVAVRSDTSSALTFTAYGYEIT